MFLHAETAERWFVNTPWPDGVIFGPACRSKNVQARPPRNGVSLTAAASAARISRCKTGTVMQSSKRKLDVWAMAIYRPAIGLKGVSSRRPSPRSEWDVRVRLALGKPHPRQLERS